jgi:hypothetical protein
MSGANNPVVHIKNQPLTAQKLRVFFSFAYKLKVFGKYFLGFFFNTPIFSYLSYQTGVSYCLIA